MSSGAGRRPDGPGAGASAEEVPPPPVPSAAEQRSAGRERLARIRRLYDGAPEFLRRSGLQRAAAGHFVAVRALVVAFVRSFGEDEASKDWEQLCVSAERALGTALVELFGADLPRVLLPRGSFPETQRRACAGFGVEGADFPARPVQLGAAQACAVREVRRQRRLQDGDLGLRPAAERGDVAGGGAAGAEAAAGGGSSRYLSELLGLACGPELLRLRLYPDAKELTESFAAFRAVREHLGSAFSPGDASATVVCVGDGSCPRTAALFAFRTKWRCLAVDPQMRDPGQSWGGVERLEAVCAKIEECRYSAERLLLVCVHAHVGLPECLGAVEWTRALGIVAMPCCNFYTRLRLPSSACGPAEGDQPPPPELLAEYHDAGVVSPHRLVRVYLRES